MRLHDVVVIDDSEFDRVLAWLLLEAQQLADHVFAFETAAQGLSFLRETQLKAVDLILLDLDMPDMDGMAFLRAYEALPSHQQAHAGVIVVTANVDEARLREVAAVPHVRGIVPKPLTPTLARELCRIREWARLPGSRFDSMASHGPH